MDAFWDVVWSDAKALAAFLAPMLGLSLVASAAGAVAGGGRLGPESRGRLLRAIGGGLFAGGVAAFVASMLVEMSLKAEGLPYVTRVLREHASIQLLLIAPGVALFSGYFAARRFAPGPPGSATSRSRYTLRQLFIGQLIAGLLLGWWVYTRRDQIFARQFELYWESREREAKAVFEPLGWYVEVFPDDNEIHLSVWAPTPSTQQPVRDDDLALVVRDGAVTSLMFFSDAVTDAGLAHLEGATRLRELWIASDEITDEGVRKLCELPRLRYLGVRSPHLTGASLQHLTKVKSLRYVSLSTALITPEEEAAFRSAKPTVDLRFNERGW